MSMLVRVSMSMLVRCEGVKKHLLIANGVGRALGPHSYPARQIVELYTHTHTCLPIAAQHITAPTRDAPRLLPHPMLEGGQNG